MATDFDDVDTDAAQTEVAPGTRLHATINYDGTVATRLLPVAGDLVIGRAADCDLVVPHASVSRRHATLMLSPLAVVDAGSRNGTRAHGQEISREVPMPIAIGDAIQIGEATIVIQAVPLSTDGRPLVSERDAGVSPVTAECVRSARTGSPFAVVQLAIEGSKARQVVGLLRDLLRASDVVVEQNAREVQVVLVETGGSHVEIAVSRIAQVLQESEISARIGLARYPDDGVLAEQLVAHAYEQVSRDDDAPPLVMDGVRTLVRQIASGELSVLILGETGVGKELYAEMIHRLSPRAMKPFVKLNCSALVESLIESELFGHERGAFTGAMSAHQGLLESGDGGTVFLDEIGELPLGIQAKLLRVLEERVVRRIGATTGRKIDVRFVFATNRDLAAEVEAGKFRRDLYYRINGISISIPPLRERPREILPLARAFAADARRGNAPIFGAEVAAALQHHSWPGNIRELRNTIERALLLSSGGAIRPSHLALESPRDSSSSFETARPTRASRPTMPLASTIADVERERIVAALEECAGNQSRAAKQLGISRTTLQARIDAYGLPRPRTRK